MARRSRRRLGRFATIISTTALDQAKPWDLLRLWLKGPEGEIIRRNQIIRNLIKACRHTRLGPRASGGGGSSDRTRAPSGNGTPSAT